ncbi:hypothetical protein [Mycobacterium talmoniae]|uniref:Uncharacterized protein n=1 Tax=Mycobacterium talmoniae TaxID=1858794 RepID=A0A1S1NKN9_9MYCO|nr:MULTISPECIES: hypothetical protein [Mycobacterium]OHV05075.1 hypothetical protein BKN37_07250 [Mycobacterium talmoniae]PQM45439.1 hypothetical protein C1Y40_04402 [Mycobacterium talmoniae]TDH56160.1 hypothetical protein E2F47_07790 [Mycobacterium eburneum]
MDDDSLAIVDAQRWGSASVARWAATHHGQLVVVMVLNTVGVTFWLPFGAAVWAYLRDRLPAGSTLPACFAAAFIALAMPRRAQ